MVLSKLALYACIAGISSHPIIRRAEPTVPAFVITLVLSGVMIILASWAVVGTEVKTAVYHTIEAFLSFLLSLAGTVVLYRLSPWHPLAKYPGPTSAKITKWWMAIWIAKGNRHLKLQELHGTYGPWVRIGPNEISVNVPDAIKPIYSQMFRAPFYQGAPQDADALITTTDRDEHARRLVAWNKAFSNEMVQIYRGFAQTRLDQLVDILKQKAVNGKNISLSHWISLWAMDVMGDMAFSGGFETMAAGRDSEGWMEVLSMGVLFVGILGQVPWMKDVIALLPQPGPIITFQKACFSGEKVKETKAKSAGMKKDILGIIQDEESGGYHLSAKEASADASFIVVAGSDTIAQALMALLRYIIGNGDAMNQLRAEISEATDGGTVDVDAATLTRLPYLDACVQEALRLVPPVPAGPPRYSGDHGCEVLGRFIPPHTTVACPIFTLHRDRNNFARPDEFIPERWLQSSNIQPHSRDAYVPFSYGSGVCIGKQVALQNMKLFTAGLLNSFDLSFGEGFDVAKYDASYKEHNLWLHDSLEVRLVGRVNGGGSI
ncbi:cytochrome P450 [Gloeophyllum trabeum ATCC 11539]|uniref:Cytochrome P450 n=1 Tax=Gloeophyllum trabeum (strain ATCC 11539 / FP-39264 / Madison 617) TaxID=670483 RepID=S7R8I7_GLOTA|nr:cytochrome P450 [Gloeophyllum trabeum ATCC 11539]EPQ50635.1 cytochrome P450 [Gloeophyllum trabeum ATCC 11539]